MADEFETQEPGLNSPATDAFLITPDDNADLAKVTRGLVIGTDGAVKVTTKRGTTLVLPTMPQGYIWPLRVKRVFSTGGTTATNLVGLS